MTTTNNNKIFRAFRNRNYALFFTGQSISQIGTWMQRTAVVWVIYSLTHSAAMIGFAVFAQQFPAFLLSLFGGVVADRHPRARILLITQTASMVQAILLAVLILTNHYIIWEMLVLSSVLGIINAFDVPARQPMVHDMVDDKADLANAISLNSAMVNLARLIGPALSGMVLQRYGAGVCFSLNAVSFIAVIISLLLMKFPAFTPPAVKKKVFSELTEGFGYLKKTPAISLLIVLVVCLSLFVWPYDTLEPVFAKVIFKGDATTYGWLTGCVGLGALIGSFLLASAKKGIDLRKILLVTIVVVGAGLILFSRMTHFWPALPFALILGLGSITPMSTSITIVQMEAAPQMRGRVMSWMALAFFGMQPLGGLIVGSISKWIGAADTITGQGIAALMIGLIHWRYLRKENLKKEQQMPAVEEPHLVVV